ncbi:recombination directionality factor [Immundisolibacter sp.]
MLTKNELKFKIPCNPNGAITSGIKVVSERTGKEYPKALDYFVIEDFPELVNSYGQKPKKLVLFFPTNDIAGFLDINYVLYGSNQQLIRKCNGETCFHRIDNEIDEKTKFKAGQTTPCICKEYGLSDDHKKKCHVFFWMKAFIGDLKLGKVNSPVCYLFKSGSKNSAENIISEINKVLDITGGNLVGIPFGLSVDMVSGSTDAQARFPIWTLQVLGSIEQILAWNKEVKLRIPTKAELKLLATPTENYADDIPFDPTNPLQLE